MFNLKCIHKSNGDRCSASAKFIYCEDHAPSWFKVVVIFVFLFITIHKGYGYFKTELGPDLVNSFSRISSPDKAKINSYQLERSIALAGIEFEEINNDQVDSLLSANVLTPKESVIISNSVSQFQSCDDYWKIKKLDYDFENQNQLQRFDSLGIFCDVLHYLDTAHPFDHKMDIYSDLFKLPASLLIPVNAVNNREIDSLVLEGNPLTRVKNLSYEVRDRCIHLQHNGFLYKIFQLYKADFNHDGIGDILVGIEGKANNGSFSKSSVACLQLNPAQTVYKSIQL